MAASKKTNKSVPVKKSGSVPPPPGGKTPSVRPPPPAAAPVAAAPAVAAPVATTVSQKTHSFKRKIVGRVVSDKMAKTIVVEVIRYAMDRVYKKYVKRRLKYKAHDELNQYRIGDKVEIQESRPMSREKRWAVVRLISRPVME